MSDVFFIIIGLFTLVMSLSYGVNFGLLLISLLIIGRHGFRIYFRHKENKSAEDKELKTENKEAESSKARHEAVTLRVKDEKTEEENTLVFNDGDIKYIGRSPRADIHVDDIYFGALSCALIYMNGKIILRNQSKNGAWVLSDEDWLSADNGIEVKPGDTIKVVDRLFSIEKIDDIDSLRVRFRIIHDNKVQNMRLADNQQILIGRSPEAHICIQDQKISRIHCAITNSNGRLLIEDMQSKNGTWIFNGSNWQRLQGKTLLRSGDAFRVATTEIIVEKDSADEIPYSLIE